MPHRQNMPGRRANTQRCRCSVLCHGFGLMGDGGEVHVGVLANPQAWIGGHVDVEDAEHCGEEQNESLH